ncbi:MAG: hypothetical protein OXH20_01205 [bacterium]|nr:hypothetical protein [bacterium]
MAWHARLAGVLAAGVLLLAQCGGDDGDQTDGDAAAPAAPEVAATSVTAPPAPTATAAPPALSDPTTAPAAPNPLPPEPPAPVPTTPVEQPAPSGPPPVAVGTMPELRIDAGGYPHALFAAQFFSGPVDGISAASSDTTVATAGVSEPDMVIVTPVSRGDASVTLTASGPGGTATQTFTVRVQTGAEPSQVAAPPSPAPPAPQDPEPFVPAEQPPAAAPPGPSVPEETLPAQAVQPEEPPPDDQSLYLMASEPVTAAPTLAGSIPAQTLIVENSGTVSASAYFSGVVQGWEVRSSAPASVPVSVTEAGVVRFSGDTLGTFTITVTARNDVGSARHGFTVAVKTADQVILTTVGDRPQLVVAVGRTITVDLSRYFSEAATTFDLTYDRTDSNRLIDVTVQGSAAQIQGLRAGTVTITLVAASATARISRPATVQVTG